MLRHILICFTLEEIITIQKLLDAKVKSGENKFSACIASKPRHQGKLSVLKGKEVEFYFKKTKVSNGNINLLASFLAHVIKLFQETNV